MLREHQAEYALMGFGEGVDKEILRKAFGSAQYEAYQMFLENEASEFIIKEPDIERVVDDSYRNKVKEVLWK